MGNKAHFWWGVLFIALGMFFLAELVFGTVLQSKTSEKGYLIQLADFSTPGRFELFSTPPHRARIKIVAVPNTQNGVEPGFLVSVGHEQVVYMQGSTDLRRWALKAIPVAGGPVVQLSPSGCQVGASVEHGFSLHLGSVDFWMDCLVDEVYREFDTALPGTIFGSGFNDGTTGGWQ